MPPGKPIGSALTARWGGELGDGEEGTPALCQAIEGGMTLAQKKFLRFCGSPSTVCRLLRTTFVGIAFAVDPDRRAAAV